MLGTLFFVATPIGNLEDISQRALRVLREVDYVICEDTRVTGKLLAHFQISKPLRSLHEHSEARQIDEMLRLLQAGKSLVYVSDAGTPGVNDPGGKLSAAALKAGVVVSPIPGASALTAALSVCGFPMEEFAYLGFAPHKKGRETFFTEIAKRDMASVFFESTHRIAKALASLTKVLDATRLVCVCRELTKIHETIYRGTIDEVVEKLNDTSLKGEFVIIIAPKKFKDTELSS